MPRLSFTVRTPQAKFWPSTRGLFGSGKTKSGPLKDRSERGKEGRGKSQGRRCKMKSRQMPGRSRLKRRQFWKRVKSIKVCLASFICSGQEQLISQSYFLAYGKAHKIRSFGLFSMACNYNSTANGRVIGLK